MSPQEATAAGVNEHERQERHEIAAPPPAPRSRGGIVWVLALVVLAAGAYLLWRTFFAQPALPDSIVALSGRIEGDVSALAAKTSGHILEVRVREGDSVKAGEIVAVLSDEQVRAREEQARAAVVGADAKTKAARDQIAVLQQQLQQNQLQTEQSKMDAEGRVSQAQSDLAAAEADLAQREASYQIASFDKDAYTRLAQTGAVSERRGKQAVAAAGQEAAAVEAAKRRVNAAQGALTMATANLQNPTIREAQVSMVRMQIAQQEAEVASAHSSMEETRARLREAEANRQDLNVVAPFSGTVATRAAEPGEVVTAGTAIVTLVDLSKVYLRGFVPEGQIGKVKVGQPSHIYIDSNPHRAIDAYVSRIDPTATFTPENTYFRDERVKQVVGVKLQLKAAFGFAKPGMPADGEILVQGDTWPQSHRK
jgi:HlyD family secretion protein